MSDSLKIQFHTCSICDFTSPSVRAFVTHIGMKHKDDIREDKSTIIGRGEKVLVEILKSQLPGVKIYTQVHLKYFVPREEVRSFSERSCKETIDVLAIHKGKWYACRVQDSRHQKGPVLMQADLVQKNLIQRYHGKNSVIDFRESECKNLFGNKNNWYSHSEVGIVCMLEGMIL